jgi:hypothetical protein
MSVERWPAVSLRPSRDLMLVCFIDRRTTEAVWAQWIDSLGNHWGPNFEVCRTRNGRTTPHCALKTVTNYAYIWEDSRDGHQDIYWYFYGIGEARVNDDFASTIQDFPCVGIDTRGRALCAWFDYRNALWDADIYAQRYDAEGYRDGCNFRVNDDGLDDQQHFVRVGVNPAGTSVVIWRDSRRGSYDYFGQLFRPDHSREGTNFLVTDTPGPLYLPRVSINGAGDFVVGWSVNKQSYTQMYHSDGSRMGENQRLGNSDEWAAPLLLPDCSYYLAWHSNDSVLLGRFDSLGQTLMPVQTLAAGEWPGQVDLIQDPYGAIWVAWIASRAGGLVVLGRRCDQTGTPIGEVFQINDDWEPCEHWFPCWACDGERMYVAFTDFRVVGDINVEAQVYDLDGVPLGSNYCVNHDPHPYCHQWAWQSVAAVTGGFVAYAWVDNRNLRSWDMYFRLHTEISGIPEPEPTPAPTASIMRASQPLRVDFGGLTGDARVQLFDRQGRMVRELFNGQARASGLSLSMTGLVSGVYFVRTESVHSTTSRKLVIVG